MNVVVDVCRRCGKKVVKQNQMDSSDMVKTCDAFLYLCDLKPGESSRPVFSLRDYSSHPERTYCLDCLLEELCDWVAKMKERGPSKIPWEEISGLDCHILDGFNKPGGGTVQVGNKISSPCPICGK